MREVEVKILDINVEEIKKKLLELGAKKIFDGKIHYKTFDFSDNFLRNKRQHLRVRKMGDKVEVTHKGTPEQVDGFKIRREIETHVEDFDAMCEIFEKLGMSRVYEAEKLRQTYKLENAKIEFDTYPGIKTYLEIETSDEKELMKTVQALGFTMDQTRAIGAQDLLKEKGIDTQKKPLLFENALKSG